MTPDRGPEERDRDRGADRGGAHVVEVELNPVLVGREGATAVDALWIEEIA